MARTRRAIHFVRFLVSSLLQSLTVPVLVWTQEYRLRSLNVEPLGTLVRPRGNSLSQRQTPEMEVLLFPHFIYCAPVIMALVDRLQLYLKAT